MTKFKFGRARVKSVENDAVMAMAYAIKVMVETSGIPKKYFGRNTDPIKITKDEYRSH